MIVRRLTDEDNVNLSSYEHKCKEVRQFGLACLTGTQTGLMLFGSGGSGKSYSIREMLKERDCHEITAEEAQAAMGGDDEEDERDEDERDEFGYETYVVHQGRISAKGLVKKMASFPKSIHLIEDAETLFDDKESPGVLRQSLHSQDHSLHSTRRVTWSISTRGSFDFYFRGSLIVIANRTMNDATAEVQAIKTRCPCLTFAITNKEALAKMKDICNAGYREIPSFPVSRDECYDVLEFIVNARDNDPDLRRTNLNFRLLISGFRFTVLQKMEPSIDWRQLLLSQMKEQIGASRPTRRERIMDEHEIALEVSRIEDPHQRMLEWCKQTGRSYEWASAPRDSDEYKKGFATAKTDYHRKKRAK
jgi:hypothetical protein